MGGTNRLCIKIFFYNVYLIFKVQLLTCPSIQPNSTQESDNILPCCVHFCEDHVGGDEGGASLDERHVL